MQLFSGVRARARRTVPAGLLVSAALVVAEGISLPVSFDGSDGVLSVTSSHAKGGGGAPDAPGGGQGGGHGGGDGGGQGHRGGNDFSNSGGKGNNGSDDDEGNDDGALTHNGNGNVHPGQLGKLNAAINANANALANANENSKVGKIAAYIAMVEDGASPEEALEFLQGIANKGVDEDVFEAINLYFWP